MPLLTDKLVETNRCKLVAASPHVLVWNKYMPQTPPQQWSRGDLVQHVA
jgi:hypothetical protein